MKTTIEYNPNAQPPYAHMETLVDFLLANGHSLARADRWHNDMAAQICFVKEPINFDLIEQTFELPPCIQLSKDRNAIECDITWRTIQTES
ncbi:hypothetical protein [Oceanicoccus sp. KOV_DT_Chl]|uniref:hypothetical protein n=1 Tax=Oceanicoccus sp. KOV_DT_Chl TaxID=1904639 RepID=UPI000C7D1C10|nr:hypothetical protein [Oceanicoccus sp. KOV_DT_Chl]